MSQTKGEISDEGLVLKARKGEVAAFSELVNRYENKILRYARKFLLGAEDAKDLLQEIFIKVYQNLQSFDADRRFSPWIYRIAHNEFINFIKKKGREPMPFFDPDSIFPHPVAKEQSDKQTRDKETKGMLDKCLQELDWKYREPLVLFYLEEMSYQEISEILQIPIATVGIRLKRGREAIKKVCQKFGYEYQ